jgi:hypothetical protein
MAEQTTCEPFPVNADHKATVQRQPTRDFYIYISRHSFRVFKTVTTANR